MATERIAFSVGDTKQSALYFDYVIPLALASDLSIELGGFDFLHKILQNDDHDWEFKYTDPKNKLMAFMPPVMRQHENFDLWAELNVNLLWHVIHIRPLSVFSSSDIHKRYLEDATLRREGRALNRLLNKFIDQTGISDWALTSDSSLCEEPRGSEGEVFVTINGLQLIDTEAISLESISEFRKDKSAQEKLRRLRLFASGNFQGRTARHIEDDLLQRIDDYQAEARRWSFKTKSAAAAMLFKSKFLAGGMGCSLVGAILDKPLISVASAAIGTLAEFGNVAIEVARINFAASEALGNNPISYIVEARRALGAGQA